MFIPYLLALSDTIFNLSMNNEMLKKINSIYANDFKYYGYKLRITEPQTMDDSD